ncbi:hypothetical protein Sulac_1430 [Sulfobacillus acidophilus DSM 10332]|uniref:Uncharacterized protein n=1 Tax=Sulfobacillus acidophilus (strain ATCC 700253 / DSM 10332 / NAL) TaxID=679936 RepID=G8TX19_SULAD|nr:hypothetical protein Sulac_1430 [Sulfobacillus acidophilus DSM 10332]
MALWKIQTANPVKNPLSLRILTILCGMVLIILMPVLISYRPSETKNPQGLGPCAGEIWWRRGESNL